MAYMWIMPNLNQYKINLTSDQTKKSVNWVWRHIEAVHEGINPREESPKEKAYKFDEKGENSYK